MTIKGIGTDVISITRVNAIYKRYGQKLLQKICTRQEIDGIGHRSLPHFIAKRFAAKEAYAKALGFGIGQGIGWHDIEIVNHEGRPCFSNNTKYIERYISHLSISDEENFAVAFVVLENK